MAAMANRKKGDYSVLSEINTEEEWLTLLERKVRKKVNIIIKIPKKIIFQDSLSLGKIKSIVLWCVKFVYCYSLCTIYIKSLYFFADICEMISK